MKSKVQAMQSEAVKTVAPSADAAECTKPCNTCHRELPASRFRRIDADTGRRAPRCAECHAAAERQRRAAKQHQDDRNKLHQAWSEIAQRKHERQALAQFVVTLFARFGGPKGLARSWHQAFVEATCLRRLRAAESLVLLLDFLSREPENYSGLSDLELSQQLQQDKIRVIREVMRSEPALVEALASEVGYAFVPC